MLSLWFGGRAALASAESLAPRWLVAQWRYGLGPEATEQRWDETQLALRAALDTGPDHAELRSDIAFLHAARAHAMGAPAVGSPEYAAQQGWFDEAIAQYRAATVLRPTFPYAWVYLALAKYRRGQPEAEMWAAFDKALAYGVNEGGVQQALATVAFANWAAAGRERQTAITSMVAGSHANARPQLVALAAEYGIALAEMPPAETKQR